MFWKLLAKIASIPVLRDAIIRKAQKTPYTHLQSRDGDGRYMGRWWLFNGYASSNVANRYDLKRFPFLPSIRVHHICLPDNDRHEHDHPFFARSLIIKGFYVEERRKSGDETRVMRAGDTNKIIPNDFHRIVRLSDEGVWTIFITFNVTQSWGFWVDGKKVDRKDYK